MKRVLSLFVAAAVLAACNPAPQDLALCGGRAVRGLTVTVSTDTPAEFPGMSLRSVAFINQSGSPVKVDAIETSRIAVSGADIWSLQPTSSEARKDWVLPVGKGFSQRNYLGMNDPDYGGGIPMVSLWTQDTNLSVGVAEPALTLVSMPVSRKGGTATACIRQDFDEPVTLAPGDTLVACRQFVMESKGDFFNPLREFAAYKQGSYSDLLPMHSALLDKELTSEILD